jgi:hypothetical protein
MKPTIRELKNAFTSAGYTLQLLRRYTWYNSKRYYVLRIHREPMNIGLLPVYSVRGKTQRELYRNAWDWLQKQNQLKDDDEEACFV